MLEDGETCVELNSYDNGPVINTNTIPRRETVEPKPEPEPDRRPGKPGKKSIFKSWGERLSRLMQEDDENAEDEQ